VLLGAHVRTAGGLLAALERAEALGAQAVQLFAASPRVWAQAAHRPEALHAYREAAHESTVVEATFVHAAYLINLATGDDALRARSRERLAGELVAASELGAAGVVVHVGSHRGAGFDAARARVGRELVAALDMAAARLGGEGCPLLVENTAGAGGTVGRSLGELAAILDAAGGDERLGVCLDTQHLFASGVAFRDREEADEVVAGLRRADLLGRLACVHLNDSKVALGANRDRHANLGEGHIGLEALGLLISHPALDGLPGLLEVPGAGEGPRRTDLEAARRALELGRRLRAAPRRRGGS